MTRDETFCGFFRRLRIVREDRGGTPAHPRTDYWLVFYLGDQKLNEVHLGHDDANSCGDADWRSGEFH